MAKFITYKDAISLIPNNAVLMCGGFLGMGAPTKFYNLLAKSSVSGLTLISNDGSQPNMGIANLIHSGKVKKLITSHIGKNPEINQLMSEGKLEVDLIPEGTLVERIRAGGAGLGGVLTDIGVFSPYVSQGKNTVVIDGKTYLVELPIHADFAIIYGSVIDRMGNIWYRGTTRNLNPAMATAADTVIVEADDIVEVGDIEPENVIVPSLFVDYILEEDDTLG